MTIINDFMSNHGNAVHIERWGSATRNLKSMIQQLFNMMNKHIVNASTWMSNEGPDIAITYTLKNCLGDGQWEAQECYKMREALNTRLRINSDRLDRAYKSIWGDVQEHYQYCTTCGGSGVYLEMTAGDLNQSRTEAPFNQMYWDQYSQDDIDTLQVVENWADISGAWNYDIANLTPEQLATEEGNFTRITEALHNFYADVCETLTETLAAANHTIDAIDQSLVTQSYHEPNISEHHASILRMLALHICNPNHDDLLQNMRISATPGTQGMRDTHFFELHLREAPMCHGYIV